MIDEIEPRYRSQYFSHIFAGGYSAGYYAYLWSEILDSDGFAAFKQTENIFDPETAARLKKWVYESGGLREADELYRNFRGQDPKHRTTVGRTWIRRYGISRSTAHQKPTNPIKAEPGSTTKRLYCRAPVGSFSTRRSARPKAAAAAITAS